MITFEVQTSNIGFVNHGILYSVLGQTGLHSSVRYCGKVSLEGEIEQMYMYERERE